MMAAVLASSAAPAAAQSTTNRLLGLAMPDGKGTVTALAVLPNGDLAAGAACYAVGGAGDVARWKGSTWVPLGTGMNGRVSALAVFPNGDLVAGGGFTTAGGGGASHIARWNGSTRTFPGHADGQKGPRAGRAP